MSKCNFFDDKNYCYNSNDRCNNRDDSCNEDNKPCVCPPGPRGPQGEVGPVGPAGGILNYADFYALMPPDNSATVAPGTDVSFPQDGPNSGSGIARSGPDSFNLADVGVYQVMFQVSATEAF